MKKCVWSRLSVLTGVAMLAAGSLVSCSNDDKGEPPTPPVELKNQIEYNGGALIDIKSAIFDVEDTDLYTFYLSPTSGITDVAGMTAANDYLRVMIRKPAGTVNTATDTFEIGYKEISVKKQTMNDVEKAQLSADLVKETQQLNLYINVTLKSGKTLLARYNSACAEAVPPMLTNQYELNKVSAAIGSVLSWYNPIKAITTYYFYTQSDISAPVEATPAAMEITVADGTETANIDLSKAKAEDVSVKCGTFSNATATTGTLSIANADGTLTVTLDARSAGSRLRTAYTGTPTTGSTVTNHMTVTPAGGSPVKATLTKVFRHTQSALSNHFALGFADATAPEGLLEGTYAVRLELSDQSIGKTIDLATSGLCPFYLYDNKKYETFDISKIAGVTGSVTTSGTKERMYLHFSVAFPNGPTVEGEWFGDVTAVATAFDITPIKPFVPHITITDKNGVVKLEKTIASMEVRLENNYSLRGGDPQYGGAKFNAYFFYFRPENVKDPIETPASIPQLMIPAAYLNSTNLNLAVPQTDLHWKFNYGAENNLQYGSNGYTELYTMYGMKSGYCPTNVTTTVIRNTDKTWNVTFEMKDAGTNEYNSPWGYNTTIVIEWKGIATKYTGSKTNNLTAADY